MPAQDFDNLLELRLVSTRKEAQQAVAKVNNKRRTQTQTKLRNLLHTNPKAAHKILFSKSTTSKGGSASIQSVRGTDKQVLSDPTSILASTEAFFSDLFSPTLPPDSQQNLFPWHCEIDPTQRTERPPPSHRTRPNLL
jgi:hypothetical protein